MEHKVAQILQDQQDYGWRFDEDAAWELTQTLQEELRNLTEVLRQRHPYVEGERFTPSRRDSSRGYFPDCEFTRITQLNPTSRDHISWVLQKHYSWSPTNTTATGKATIDETVLLTIGKSIPIANTFARCLTIKKILGMMSQGVNAWLKLSTKSRIHHHCSTATNTFRCAHRKPNLGQVPSDPTYRKLFLASPGMELVGADLSGIELRILSHYLARYDGGRYADILLKDDIHQVNADKIGISRRQTKAVTYSFLYGAGDEKLGHSYDEKLSPNKAKAKGREIRAAYVAAIDGLDKLLADVAAVGSQGSLKAIDGRRIILDSKHKALNYLLQGSAAVIAKRWMLIAHDNIKQIGIKANQLGFIHDELQFETYPPNINDLCSSLVLAATQAGEYYNLRVRIDAEAKSGSSWADTH